MEEKLTRAEEEVLERKRQFEAIRPQMLEVCEVLPAPALEDLIPARPVYGTKWGTELDPQAVAAGRRKQLGSLEEHDFSWPGRSASGASGWTTAPPAEPR